ncbi:unnamed protein product [Caenorhabditis nigoni]
MEMSSDLIKENHHLLQTCILYEVLQKTPIFDSYRSFCDTVGPDAMSYPDFEFWYLRFCRGELDFDYDRSVDPEPKTLMDMPVKLMHKIAKNLDPVERASLRSMNHAIKTVADSFPPAFEKIKIVVSDTSLDWNLNNQSFSCFKKGSGCTLYKRNCSTVEESEECYIKKSLEYLTPLLRVPNLQVNHLSLYFFDETPNFDDRLLVPLNAKSVFIWGRTTKKVVQFLSAMNPGYLESISLKFIFQREREHYRMIYETDQFKQAKNMKLKSPWESFNVEDLVNFSHLEKFKCYLTSENTFQDVPRIRDTISTFKKLESCEMVYFGLRDNPPITAFVDALGAEIPIGPLKEGEQLSVTHRYQIPESNSCLEFKIKQNSEHTCRVNIVKLR